MADAFYLARFRNAHQNGLQGSGRGTYEQALQEIRNGRKMGHWMWYIFPQPRGFGHTQIADFYGIRSLDEARAYLQDETLNAHLREISRAVLDQPTRDVRQLMGNPDWLKLAACMTLFDYVSPNDIFADVLKAFYSGSRHNMTLDYIRTKKSSPNLRPMERRVPIRRPRPGQTAGGRCRTRSSTLPKFCTHLLAVDGGSESIKFQISIRNISKSV